MPNYLIAKVSKQNGFTLIELAVSLTIIAVLSTIGIAAFVNQNKTSTLQSAANEFASALNVAKSRAMSQVKPSSCGSSVLQGYTVTVLDSNSYKIDVNCGDNDYVIQSVDLPTNITFATSGPDTTSMTFFFSILTNSVTGSGQVTIRGYGNTKVVVIDSAGNIKLN